MDVLNAVTGLSKKDPEHSRKARALKKRLLRKFEGKHFTSANIDVSEVNFALDEDAARLQLSKIWGVAVEKVDLDEPHGSGLARRRARRSQIRDAANNRQRGQRAFNRQEREGVRRREVARAMAMHQSDDTPMGDNIRAAIAGYEKAQIAQAANEIRRAERRAKHAANLAAKTNA
jgi:hypothetical protein